VAVAQLVRVLVCGAEGRGFEPHQPPRVLKAVLKRAAFFVYTLSYYYDIQIPAHLFEQEFEC
jgi:hypothetical protein